MNEQSTNIRSRMFGGTKVSTGLVVMLAIVSLTHAAALLMNQPATYWLQPQDALKMPFRFLLQAGPIVYLAVFILYAAVIVLLLRKLNISVGLPLAAGLLFIHTLGVSRTANCGFYPLYQAHTETGCDSYSYVLFNLIALLFVLVLLGVHLPQRWVHWGRQILVPLAVLWMVLMAYGVFRAAFPPRSVWKPIAPAHSPGPRTMAAIAYDSKRQRAVLFGGKTIWNGDEWIYDNSTWEWDGQDWIQMDTPVAPTGRILHAMAYDERRERVVLYGGQNASGNLADLWEWDGTTWYRRCPVCNPAARFTHKMIFNPERHEIMIYGGQDGKVGLPEAWSWNGDSWNYFQFEDSTPALYNAPLIYDSANSRAVSFMGGSWGGTWVWEGNNRHKLELNIQPPLRDEATLVYDPLQDRSVLFGGIISDDVYLFNDTWIFDGRNWTRVETPRAPAERGKAVAFYDPVRQSIILYGGEGHTGVYSDMWELRLPEGDPR